jgi:predicted Fe-S protein YdhL (DUF1289 family)
MVRAVEITRKLDDDYYEICGPFGRKQVLQLFRCGECSHLTQSRDICRGCDRAKKKAAADQRMAVVSRQRRQAMLKDAKKRRYAMQMQASPEWRGKAEIRAIYAEAKRKTKETGIEHHVDHIYPLQGVISCGLHVPHNLRVIPKLENCTKSNGHPTHESPALVAFIAEYGQTGLEKWLVWFKKELKFRQKI